MKFTPRSRRSSSPSRRTCTRNKCLLGAGISAVAVAGHQFCYASNAFPPQDEPSLVSLLPPTSVQQKQDATPIRRLEFATHVDSAVSNKGDLRICPCCGWTGPSFAFEASGVGRADAKCPQCSSLERHRNTCAFMGSFPEMFDVKEEEKSAKQKSGALRVFHFGPHAPLANAIDRQTEFPVDQIRAYSNEKMYNQGDNTQTVRADLENLKFPDNFAHGILSFHVLEHIPDLKLAWREMHRVLKPNGWMLLEVPMLSFNRTVTIDCRALRTADKRQKECGHPEHQWYFAKKDWETNVLGYDDLFKCRETSQLIIEHVGQEVYDAFQLKNNGRVIPQYFCTSNKKLN